MIWPVVLTRQQIREVDRLAIEAYGMSSLVLMENAGRGCFDVLRSLEVTGPVAICCGKGNNAGDGFVIARHLDQAGYTAKVLLWSDPQALTEDALANYQILVRAELPVIPFSGDYLEQRLVAELDGCQWIVDALLGTGAVGEPRSPLDRVIRQLNDHPARKLAVDLPSGLDCDTGVASRATFRADHTCTLVAAKPGLLADAAGPFVGQLHTVSIGVPGKLMRELQTNRPVANSK